MSRSGRDGAARGPVEDAVAVAFRDEWGRVVATLIRFTNDWDLAEECAQEAFARALETWPRDGVPQNAGAWLTTTARNCARDRMRRASVGATKLQEVAALQERGGSPSGPRDPDDDAADSGVTDDRLRLIFTCCHPALARDSQIALTLRTLTGLTTPEIAHAFLVPEATMAQRLVRAKRKIQNAGIPYRVPPAHLLPERTNSVLAVLYLLFNEGYAASSGADHVRTGLCEEAIRLARTVVQLMPDEPEAQGLLALMLLQDARRGARVNDDAELVLLEGQDRTRWNREEIEDGLQQLDGALRRHEPGPYQVQAAIAACHATAESAADTDWREIAALYRELERFLPSPVVALNRAVAVAMADGPEAGLAIVDALATHDRLRGYHLLPATRADLLRRLGRFDEAAAEYEHAVALTESATERRYLERRRDEARAAAQK